MSGYYKKPIQKRKYDMQRSSNYAVRSINNAIYDLQQANEYHRTFYGYYDKEFEVIALKLVESKQQIEKLMAKKKNRE